MKISEKSKNKLIFQFVAAFTAILILFVVQFFQNKQNESLIKLMELALDENAPIYITYNSVSGFHGKKIIEDENLSLKILEIIQPLDNDWERQKAMYDIFMDLEVEIEDQIIRIDIAKYFQNPTVHLNASVNGMFGPSTSWHINDENLTIDKLVEYLKNS